MKTALISCFISMVFVNMSYFTKLQETRKELNRVINFTKYERTDGVVERCTARTVINGNFYYSNDTLRYLKTKP